jgi:hypothetical protein
MTDVEQRIGSLDLSLFDAVPSQTSPEDRGSLLLLQRCIRRTGSYIYLEIGSYLGGTLQPHLSDPRCAAIYSIDKRPMMQADESSGAYQYPENSTQRMLDGLRTAFAESSTEKIRTFTCDARELDQSGFSEKPDLCFIDGEHTDSAVFSDFVFCLSVCRPDGMIAFHDANEVIGGLGRIKQYLRENRIRFEGFFLPKRVFVILLNGSIEMFGKEIRQASWDESRYKRLVKWDLVMTKVVLRHPGLSRIWQTCRRWVVGIAMPALSGKGSHITPGR